MEAPVSESIDPFYLWPEHLAAFNIFLELGTQWRVGMQGPTGLDYAAVEAHLRLCRVPDDDTPLLFQEIRALEIGALIAYSEGQEKRGDR